MPSKLLTAEEWIARVDAIIQEYRETDRAHMPWRRRAEAIAQLRALGLTEGDASRYLERSKPHR